MNVYILDNKITFKNYTNATVFGDDIRDAVEFTLSLLHPLFVLFTHARIQLLQVVLKLNN